MKVRDKRTNEVIPVFMAEYAGEYIKVYPIPPELSVRDIPRDKIDIILNAFQPRGNW